MGSDIPIQALPEEKNEPENGLKIKKLLQRTRRVDLAESASMPHNLYSPDAGAYKLFFRNHIDDVNFNKE